MKMPKTLRERVRWRVRLFIVPKVARWRTGPKRVVREWLAGLKRRLLLRAHEVVLFWEAGDPYSYLVAQIMPRLADAYRVQITIVPVPPPADVIAPERERLAQWSLKDACDVAPFYGLQPPSSGLPNHELQMQAVRALLAVGARERGARLVEIADATWRGDAAALARLPQVTDAEAARALQKGDALRHKRGHYLSGMLFYGGTWYWGVDRVHYLLARLDWLGLRQPHAEPVLARKPPALAMSEEPLRRTAPAAKPRFVLECFLSLRSPYSYVAMPALRALAQQYAVQVVARPVLPMIMRGLPVPAIKGAYIMEDVAREALAHGVAYGRVQDPVGYPVLRGMSLFPHAERNGLGLEWLHEFCRLAWSQGCNMADEANLQRAARQAGLNWQETRPHLDSEDWKKPAEANQQALFDAGLWGVPSFRLKDAAGKLLYTGWGRDRIWRLAYILEQNGGALTARPQEA